MCLHTVLAKLCMQYIIKAAVCAKLQMSHYMVLFHTYGNIVDTYNICSHDFTLTLKPFQCVTIRNRTSSKTDCKLYIVLNDW